MKSDDIGCMERLCSKCRARPSRSISGRASCEVCVQEAVRASAKRYRATKPIVRTPCLTCGRMFPSKGGWAKKCGSCYKRERSLIVRDICVRCGVDKPPTGREMCRKCAAQARSEAKGRDGRRFLNGYVQVLMPFDHPKRGKNTLYIGEHVRVMEDFLGRYLRPFENVHHKNGIKNDNRIENLELWARPQPTGQRVDDLVDFAKWVVEQYPERFSDG